ncbi:hypothetical protein JVX90_14485 [Gordonia sp. PDNC005]|uniref:hypothetical protein n=1 Tax=unclassified Gordonia (in: high G+C Gram-positive bacteria) TaxID=2657482 RepID=UPI00196362E5|nr:hypothetical protein [Gordonia sp. PDNC005]QRY61614.1 hypothetical protein JVX90_14485 [Gordonia sp. PDNC005]
MNLVARLEAPVTRRTSMALIASVVVLVGVFVWCIAALGSRSAEVSATEARDELAEQAPVAVAAVFTVHRATWQHDREAARAVLAEPLAATLRPALADGPPRGVERVEWAPETIAVVDVDGDIGSAMLTVRVTVTPTSGAATSTKKSVHADFVRGGDHWRLSGLDDLA